MTPLDIARTAHEINRAYCKALGDFSQKPWNDAPTWQQQSAVTGVQFHLDNPDAKPSASHESWLKGKQSEGWVYGLTKDEDKKTHPCMCRFEALSQAQQAKDFLFKAVVDSLRRFLPGEST